MLTPYDRWVRGKRPPKSTGPPDRPVRFWAEEECLYDGGAGTVGTIILRNRECPYTCLFCGYWQETTDETPLEGQVAAQVRAALAELPPLDSVKLYNGGNFFDPQAIPPADVAKIAGFVRGIDLVVVECHPGLVGPEVARFAGNLDGRLEVAMGLEVADASILAGLNKKMTLGQFRRAAETLKGSEILVKAFILVKPPFVAEEAAVHLGHQSVEFAREIGADTVALIPTVSTPGLMEEMERDGFFRHPHLRTLYEVTRDALAKGDIRVLVDLWDFNALASCEACTEPLREAFRQVNHHQSLPEVPCRCTDDWEELLRRDRVRPWREFRTAYPDLPWMQVRSAGRS